MIICTTAESLQKTLSAANFGGKQLGFVPTMGALHQGHLSLIEASLSRDLFIVASIFVNPTQFNNQTDFDKYPRTNGDDIGMLEKAGCHLLYLPGVEDVYPPGDDFPTYYKLGELEQLLEGAYRPGHYQGVCQVVHRLLMAIKPTHLFMGIKDYQQCMVVQKLLALHRLEVEMHKVPTMREADGLAMSSRNRRLSPAQRQHASKIYQAMVLVKDGVKQTDLRHLENDAATYLMQSGFDAVDYVSIANASTLLPLQENERMEPAVVLIAAWLGEIRLIDNLAL